MSIQEKKIVRPVICCVLYLGIELAFIKIILSSYTRKSPTVFQILKGSSMCNSKYILHWQESIRYLHNVLMGIDCS